MSSDSDADEFYDASDTTPHHPGPITKLEGEITSSSIAPQDPQWPLRDHPAALPSLSIGQDLLQCVDKNVALQSQPPNLIQPPPPPQSHLPSLIQQPPTSQPQSLIHPPATSQPQSFIQPPPPATHQPGLMQPPPPPPFLHPLKQLSGGLEFVCVEGSGGGVEQQREECGSVSGLSEGRNRDVEECSSACSGSLLGNLGDDDDDDESIAQRVRMGGRRRQRQQEVRRLIQTEDDDPTMPPPSPPPPQYHHHTGSQSSSTDGIYPAPPCTAHPFRVVEHDTASVYSSISLGKVGKILGGMDALTIQENQHSKDTASKSVESSQSQPSKELIPTASLIHTDIRKMPRTAGCGRKITNEWSDVTKVEGINKVICKHCSTEISAKIERIITHLYKCTKRLKRSRSQRTKRLKRSRSQSLQITSTGSEQSDDDSLMTSTQSNVDASQPSTSSASPGLNISSGVRTEQQKDSSKSFVGVQKLQRKICDYAIITTQSQKKALDKAVASFFYASNVSFLTAEGKYFKELMNTARPGYSPPSRKDLEGQLLDEVHEEVEESLYSELNDSDCTLTLFMDGWSSVKNDPILASSVHTGKGTFLLQAMDSGAEKKTAEYCTTFVSSSVQEIKSKYNKRVFALSTDNEAKIKQMKDLMKKEDELKEILTYGCSAHYLNLLEKVVSPQAVMKHVVEVQKYFRNHHQPHGWLKEKGGVMPQIPNDTRWNSHNACLSTFTRNFYKYVEISNEHKVPDNISKILNNIHLYKEVVELQKQLSIVSEALDALQSDSATLSSATDTWNKLLKSETLAPHKDAIKSRMEEAIEPFFYVANLMDPNRSGVNLDCEQEEQAEEWIKEHKPHFLPYILAFWFRDSDIFPSSMFEPQVLSMYKHNPSKWWMLMEHRTIKKGTLPRGFCQFFKDLLSCPPSSASIERICSTFCHVWPKLRNRLGVEKATKLVKIYKHLHLTTVNDRDDVDESDDEM